jgi:ribose transport system permease protein
MQKSPPLQASVAIEEVTGLREQTLLQRLLASQPFWVTMAVLVICIATSIQEPRTFPTLANFFNTTRNFSSIGIMAMGMTAVILTGGIDLSVGSVMALVSTAVARTLELGYGWETAWLVGLAIGLACGLINGTLVAYVGLPPFVVTLGMLSIARSLGIVLSQGRVIYDFGPDADTFKFIGGGWLDLTLPNGAVLSLSHQFLLLIVITIIFSFVLKWSAWGRYLYAIGGNEQAARLTGIPVNRVKIQAYVLCSLTAALASLMLTGYAGSGTSGLGRGYELYVIAAVVIGGANLMGGAGGAYGGFIGAALIFLIRNSLIMFGVEANWYEFFIGLFIIFAVLLERIRGRKSG